MGWDGWDGMEGRKGGRMGWDMVGGEGKGWKLKLRGGKFNSSCYKVSLTVLVTKYNFIYLSFFTAKPTPPQGKTTTSSAFFKNYYIFLLYFNTF